MMHAHLKCGRVELRQAEGAVPIDVGLVPQTLEDGHGSLGVVEVDLGRLHAHRGRGQRHEDRGDDFHLVDALPCSR